MPIPLNFPESPIAVLHPDCRWTPGDDLHLEGVPVGNLLPPLVDKLRRAVHKWRDSDYAGVSETSRALLKWWFQTPHITVGDDGAEREFRYYFAQREAAETAIYLYEIAKAKDKFDLMKFTSSGEIRPDMFPEEWPRYVVKMATGSGKTSVMSLMIAWSYFHKCYEADSGLSRNILFIAPNIIVLDRLRRDFEGLRIFRADPVLPENGFEGRNWRDDFQMRIHVQDEVRAHEPYGNIFLTNIHRVYVGGDSEPSMDDDDLSDYFLGKRPTGKTTDSKADLGDIVRDIDELLIINDEAHHIHDSQMAWFKAILDIRNRLLQREDSLSLQLDFTATPKHNNGAIFAQTVADYPLVEAISQRVVKRPVLPDKESRDKLKEKPSVIYSEKYADYIRLGVEEWRKADAAHSKMGRNAVLFVMTDDTKNCDDVGAYLERMYSDEFGGKVLVIHTKDNGEISEAGTGKKAADLENLRKHAGSIDNAESPYRAVVSVLMLREGWDVRNVTTIVGLRAYTAKAKILPEQTLGRGIRRMYPAENHDEQVSVIGTKAFVEFVEELKKDGVTLDSVPMGEHAEATGPLLVEVDQSKDIGKLDIRFPLLAPRIHREFGGLEELNSSQFNHRKVAYKKLPPTEERKIVFRDILNGEITHTTTLDEANAADYRSVIKHFTREVMRELRLFSGYDILYGKMQEFIRDYLFDRPIDLENADTIRNLAEFAASKTAIETLKSEINKLTVRDSGAAEIREWIAVSEMRPFFATRRPCIVPEKSVLNLIVGDNELENEFAEFLDGCGDIISYAKNYNGVRFKLDYINAENEPANYHPDFLVKRANGEVCIAETKGRQDLDDPRKMARLRQWCEEVNALQSEVKFDFAFVDDEGFRKHRPSSFSGLMESFSEYKR